MGSMKMLFVLSIITASLALLSVEYATWVNQNNIGESQECKDIKAENDVFTLLSESPERGIIGMECSDTEPLWFSAVWLVPLAITLLFAFTPFVK